MPLSLWDFVRTLPGSFVSICRNHHGRPACPSGNGLVPQPLYAASLAGSSVTRRRPATLYATLIAAVGLVAGASGLPAQVTFTGSQSTLATLPSASSISPIAADAAGDVFFVTSGSSGNTLYELPQGGTLKALNSSFPYSPMAIAASPDDKSLYFAYNGAQCTSTSPVYSHVSIASVSSGVPQDMPCSFSFSGYNVAYTDVQWPGDRLRRQPVHRGLRRGRDRQDLIDHYGKQRSVGVHRVSILAFRRRRTLQ